MTIISIECATEQEFLNLHQCNLTSDVLSFRARIFALFSMLPKPSSVNSVKGLTLPLKFIPG